MATVEDTEDRETKRLLCETMAEREIERHRTRENVRTVAQLTVDWALLLGAAGCFLGFATAWGWLLCAIVGVALGAIVGALYGWMFVAVREAADERLDFTWSDARKKAHAKRLTDSDTLPIPRATIRAC
jgi:hypothetical protein